MKKWFRKLMPSFLMGIAAIAAIAIGVIYFHFISQRIYKDSTGHLGEIYGQVNRSFGSFVEKNWGLLEGWGDSFAALGNKKENWITDFIKKKQNYWGFSEFYFFSKDETCMTPDGKKSRITPGEEWNRLMNQGKPVMDGGTLSSGQDVTVFAAPVPQGKYKGFCYDAIAISYTNADLSESLNVDAFSGKAKCFVIHNDGSVLLSTQTGGNIFDNYLVYLKGASHLDKETVDELCNNWKKGISGLLQCKIGDTSYCILYQPVGYQDYILLSAVPQSAISAGFLSVQKTTTNVLLVIFLLVGIVVIALIVRRSRKQSHKNKMELQYREFMFSVLSNSVDDIFLMLNIEQQTVDYISPNIERLLGIPLKEAQKNIRVIEKCAVNDSLIIPQKTLEEIPLYGSKYWTYEYIHQNTGEHRWYRITIYHMSIQNVKKHIIVMSDLTDEQQMKQQLQDALAAAKSANEAKSNFLSNMSHDIRTPMNAIIGFSMLLEKDADQPDKVREYTRKITASSHHLLGLINDVLDMSKIESGKTSLNVDCFSLPELVEELNIILMPQAKAKNQTFEIHVQGSLPEQIIGDKLRLNQILINLLSNAIKYTHDGGQIKFTVSKLPQAAPQYVKLRFVVQDNGIGMSEEFQKHIFAPFSREISSVTNKIQGTGLGMAITKNMVDLMGGIIKVKSQPEQGSTFTVELSFVLPEQGKMELRVCESVTRILVADDEEDVCLNIKEMMDDTGVDISYVTNGSDAVDAAVSAHQQKEDFHVILLDWKMPGMNGVETARRIREQVGTDVPILVLTSYDWSEIEAEAREAGINAFMQKPFFPSTFWQTIEPLFSDQTEQESNMTESVLKGKLFLVVEDNELNAEILSEILNLEGADCELAVNGREAVEMFEHSEPGHYDMILMDVQMPVMNGYEATRQIRASKHPEAVTIPIVAMTANTFAEDVRDAMESGMDGHLAKPIDMAAVRELVGRLTAAKEGGNDK